jgi:hypothetical protein
MLSLLFLFSSQTRKVDITGAYTRLELREDTSVLVDIGPQKQAFIFGTNRFYENTIIRIIDGTQFQDVNFKELNAFHGVAVSGDRVELYFTATVASTVEVWVIDSQTCPEHALSVDLRGTFEFRFNARERFNQLCVFPVDSTVRSITFGFSDRSGDAYLLTNTSRYDCVSDFCISDVYEAFHISFINSFNEIRLSGSGGEVGSRECEQGYVTYVNVTSYNDHHFQSPRLSLSCNRARHRFGFGDEGRFL